MYPTGKVLNTSQAGIDKMLKTSGRTLFRKGEEEPKSLFLHDRFSIIIAEMDKLQDLVKRLAAYVLHEQNLKSKKIDWARITFYPDETFESMTTISRTEIEAALTFKP